MRKEEKQTTGEKGKIYSTECIVPGNNKRDKKAFLNEHCKKWRKIVDCERLENFSGKLEISREHFIQCWAQ